MHALRHAHRLLVPGGALVDLHPVTEEQVEAEGRVVGVIEEPGFASTDLPNVEARLREATEEGWLVLEAETEFHFLQHVDETEELVERKQERLEAQPELLRRISEARPPFVLREHAVLRRFRASEP